MLTDYSSAVSGSSSGVGGGGGISSRSTALPSLPSLPAPPHPGEALALGQAAAEVLLDRLPGALADAAATLGRMEAEQRRALEEFWEEVLARAAARQPSTRATRSAPGAAPHPRFAVAGGVEQQPGDLAERVDSLRADIAAARALLQQIKRQQQGQRQR